MSPDLLSVALRGLSFIAMAQAGGAAIYLALYGARLGPSRAAIAAMARFAALLGLVVLPAQFALEAARMAGTWSGVLDAQLQRFAWSTPAAAALAVRMAGLALVLLHAVRPGSSTRLIGLGGALAVALSFAITGHTAISPVRWLLAPLVVVHVAIVMFWFGSLRPLMCVAASEPPALAAQLVARFSRLATILVPLILLAGVAVAVALLPGIDSLATPYGVLLVAKLAAFCLLMLLAAVNKWRLAPRIATGDARIIRKFRQSLRVEWLVMAAVLMATAGMTMFLSPG